MAKVKAISVGYYKHRRVKVGEIIEMKGVDANGFYVDSAGKKKQFSKLAPDGKEVGKEERKCKWVDHVNTEAEKEIDPKEVAAVISGKNPGSDGKPVSLDDEEDAEPEVKPNKAK